MVQRNSAMGPVPYDSKKPLANQLADALTRYIDVITDEQAMGLNRMVVSELLRDMERSKTFFAEIANHDYPVTQLIKDAMEAGALRQADPEFAANQLLGLAKHFYFWPEFFLGENLAPEGAMQDCIAMFLSHYQPTEI